MARHNNPGCLFAIFKLFGSKPGAEKPLPYRLRDDFLSPAELSFYRALFDAVGNSAIIAPKVNLADIFFVVNRKENFAFHGRISQKHVDFLLCDAQTLRPLAGVELDDASHRRSDRQARDAFVDRVFEAAGLPLIHMPCRREYDRTEIQALLAGVSAGVSAPQAEPAVQTIVPNATAPTPTVQTSLAEPSVPVCPKCGVAMVRRESARGPFYGCPNYPKCRQTKSIG